MPNHAYQKELQTAMAAVRAAAEVTQAVQKNLVTSDTLAKKDRSPVTVADFASQAVVTALLGRELNGVKLVGEESAGELRRPEQAALRTKVAEHVRAIFPDATQEQVLNWIDHGGWMPDGSTSRYWTLDPIDGTKGFLRGEQYAIALALIEDGRVVLGVLACPNLPQQDRKEVGTLMMAVRGKGARLLPLKGATMECVAMARVSPVDNAAQAVICESVESGHTDQSSSAGIARALGTQAQPLRMDSQAKYVAVARGDAAIYLRLPTSDTYREKIWDHAAGVICVEEAGGTVTDIHGQPLDFSQGKKLEHNRGVIATNGKIHEQVLEVVKQELEA